MIYLDYNASTPLCEPAQQAIKKTLALFGNPSSIHAMGQRSRRVLEEARQKIAKAIDLGEGDVFFTSGATEAINTVFHIRDFETVITSEIEHDAGIKSLMSLKEFTQKQTEFIKAHPSGQIDLEHLEGLLKYAKKPILVSTLYVNNETGVIQPVKEMVALCRKYKACFHCDAVQAFGRFPLSFKDLDFDYMSISAHKCGGPKGCGALIKKREVPFNSYILGGEQEMSMRGGTQNLMGAVGFGAAAEYAVAHLDDFVALETLQSKIEKEILAYCPSAVVHGAGAQRVSNTIFLTMPTVNSQTQLMRFDMKDISVSAGSACSAGVQQMSYMLKAMSVPDEIASCAIRISLGLDTTENEVDNFIEVWKTIYDQLAKKDLED